MEEYIDRGICMEAEPTCADDDTVSIKTDIIEIDVRLEYKEFCNKDMDNYKQKEIVCKAERTFQSMKMLR